MTRMKTDGEGRGSPGRSGIEGPSYASSFAKASEDVKAMEDVQRMGTVGALKVTDQELRGKSEKENPKEMTESAPMRITTRFGSRSAHTRKPYFRS